MVKSLNTKADLVAKATSFSGASNYGKIMIGNKGFEFYNDSDSRKFIQIPWDEIDKVIVSVMFKGKWIPRYAIKTKKNGTYAFSSKDPKKALRTIRNYIDPNNIVMSLTFFQVLKRNVKNIFTRKSKVKQA
ncbi:MAG: DUF956 family protein [Sarcina sp.]